MQNGFCRYCGLFLDNHSFLEETLLICPTKPDELALPSEQPPAVDAASNPEAQNTPPPDYYEAA